MNTGSGTLAPTENKKRILWLDRLKGIAFYFVIVGHMSINKVLKSYIYSFHMPIFFFMTGFNFNIEKTYNTKFKDYFLKLFKRMLVPYIWMQLLSMCIRFLISAVSSRKEVPVALYIRGIIYGNNNVIEAPSNPLYFVLLLFLAELALYFIIKLARGNVTATYAISLALLPLSLATRGESFIWHANVVPATIIFIMIGHLLSSIYKEYEQKIGSMNMIKTLIAFVLFAALGFAAWKLNGRISIHGNKYGEDFILCVISALSSSIALALFAMKLPNSKLLSLVGMNTLFYMGLHKPLILLLEVLFKPYKTAPWFVICGSVVIFLGLVPITLIFKHFAPFVLGQSPKSDDIKAKIGQFVCVVAATCIPYQYFLNHFKDGMLKNSTPLYAAAIVAYFVICAFLFVIFKKVLKFAFLIEKKPKTKA